MTEHGHLIIVPAFLSGQADGQWGVKNRLLKGGGYAFLFRYFFDDFAVRWL